MKPGFYFFLLCLLLAALACGSTPDIESLAPTLQAGVLTAVPTIQGSLETAIPTLKAGAATALPAIGTALPPALQPGKGLPLPGTAIPELLGKLSEESASLALQAYARDVFGVDVDVTMGKGVTGDYNLPLTTEDGTQAALNLAGVTYFGLLKDGVLSLSLGSGVASGDLTASIQEGSLGIISLKVNQAMPAAGEPALALIKATYPGLAALEFTLNDSTQGTYTFSSGGAEDWSLKNGQVTLKGSVITAGLSPTRRQGVVSVWATVASGNLATPYAP